MPDEITSGSNPKKRLTTRLLSAFALALALAFSTYVAASVVHNAWFGSIWFLGLLPALLCALISYVADPNLTRGPIFYLLMPIGFVLAVILGTAFAFDEGIICLLILSPIWVPSGIAGSFLLRAARRYAMKSRTLRSSLIVIPLVVGITEAQIPFPHEQVELSRSVVVYATPEEIWPYAVASHAIAPTEGRWNITQNLIGIPRPRGVTLAGTGVGAVRTAFWGDQIQFQERVTQWVPGEKLAWVFNFADGSLQKYTDQHISPDGQFLKIDSGDYTIQPLEPGITKLTLSTHYIAKTHVNSYAELWGELLLGDVQNNVLAIIKHRAESDHAKAR
jgi:hypothetical protein